VGGVKAIADPTPNYTWQEYIFLLNPNQNAWFWPNNCPYTATLQTLTAEEITPAPLPVPARAFWSPNIFDALPPMEGRWEKECLSRVPQSLKLPLTPFKRTRVHPFWRHSVDLIHVETSMMHAAHVQSNGTCSRPDMWWVRRAHKAIIHLIVAPIRLIQYRTTTQKAYIRRHDRLLGR